MGPAGSPDGAAGRGSGAVDDVVEGWAQLIDKLFVPFTPPAFAVIVAVPDVAGAE